MASLTIDMLQAATSKFIFVTPESYTQVRDGEAAAKTGIIRPTGILPVIQAANAGTLATWNAFENAHADIAGYRLLAGILTGQFKQLRVTFVGDPAIPTGEMIFDEWATTAGAMDGVESNNSTVTASIRGRKTVPGTEECKIRIDIYHRTTGGTETLLDSFTTPDLTSSFANYTGDVTLDGSWADDELLVAKCTAINLGVPA